MDAEEEVGRKIESLRLTAGMGQRDLSDKLREAGVNWSQGTLSKVENGTRPIRFTEAVKLAQILDIPTAELQPTGGLVDFLYQQASWQHANARKTLTGAHHDFTSAANRKNAMGLIRELTSGARGPFVVHGSGSAFIDALDAGIGDEHSAATTLDGLELLRILGVPDGVIDRKRADILDEMEKMDGASPAVSDEDWFLARAQKSPEDRGFWIDQVLLFRYTEVLLCAQFPFLHFEPSSSAKLIVDGLADSHDWTAEGEDQ